MESDDSMDVDCGSDNDSAMMDDGNSISSSSTFQKCDETVEDFEDRLALVFTEQNMSHTQIRASLPIEKVAGGEYLHLGVETGILPILSVTPVHMIPDLIELDFSTDDASLDKASKILMWPIQVRIANILDSSPEIVGIFQRTKKPTSATEFLKPFTDELLSLLQNGIEFCRQKKMSVFEAMHLLDRLFMVIEDTIVKLLVLNVMSDSVQRNSICSGVIAYKGTNHAPRTHDEYSSMIDLDHYNGPSAIASLPFDLMSNVVFDYMYLVCLGLMENILQGITDGRFVQSAKLSKPFVEVLIDRLEQVKNYCPQDFARKPVSIDKHSKFKATKHRQILLCSGPVVFIGLDTLTKPTEDDFVKAMTKALKSAKEGFRRTGILRRRPIQNQNHQDSPSPKRSRRHNEPADIAPLFNGENEEKFSDNDFDETIDMYNNSNNNNLDNQMFDDLKEENGDNLNSDSETQDDDFEENGTEDPDLNENEENAEGDEEDAEGVEEDAQQDEEEEDIFSFHIAQQVLQVSYSTAGTHTYHFWDE
ncbi:hypothetical protein TSAR_010557 [Trichomalopsis sarcophagae]|uniref:Uncharacterized protein n=1 Tax=Trichomalopsis sarcophagae TaxID=543379 RepID=A0A232EKQ0_9HYME|nr:hypothetical protein TSAR_010557 [Trichomalopsis sarcophagae]